MAKTIEQAAIVLLGMGEEQAAQVLKYMDQDQVEKLVIAMNNMKDINPDTVNTAMMEFLQATANQTGLGVKNDDFIRNTLITALGREKADSVLDKTIINADGGMDVLKWQSPATIYDLICNEHPQLIAVIMTMVGGDKAAKVMKLFNGETRVDIVNRIALLGPLSPIALSTINEVLTQLTSQLASFKELPIGGAKKIADIVAHFDSEDEELIMESLSEIDEALTEKIQDFMFPFEAVAEIESRSLQMLLREVPTEQLTIAIKSVDDAMKEVFFSNMSARAADMIKDDLEAMGPTPLTDVIAAQKEVVAIAQRMSDEGKIVIGGAGGDQMV